MHSSGDVVPAAVRSLQSSLGREPSPDEVVSLLVNNQVPLLSMERIPAESFAVSAGAGLGGARSGVSFLEGGRAHSTHPDELTDLIRRILDSASLRHAVETDRRTYEEVQGNFAMAAHAWEARGVASICFKSAGIAPSYPYTSENFDILFQPRDEPAAKAVLDDLGYVLLANCDEPQKWLYRLFVAGRSVSAIHLHTRVGWGQGFMLDPEIWNRRRQSTDDPVTWVPGPEDAILINAAHAFFENKAFGLHDIMKVRRAIADGVDWDHVDHVARERGWLSALHFALSMMGTLEARLFEKPLIPLSQLASSVSRNRRMEEQLHRAASLPLEMPFPTSWKLVKILFFDKLFRDRHEPLRLKPTLLFLTMARAAKSQTDARPQNSALFTLSGIDGSGKTRQAESLLDAIDVCHLRARIMWARLGATPTMHRLSRLWSSRQDETTDAMARRPLVDGILASGHNRNSQFGNRAISPNDGLLRMVWATMSSADFAVWLLRIRWRMARGDMVIADRYLCDFDVELTAKLPSRPRFRCLLLVPLKLIAPQPRRAFLLDVDAPASRERALPDGGDFDPDLGIGLYRQRAPQYGLDAVDACASFQDVSTIIQREALRSYFNHYGMLSNFFFFMNPMQLNRPVRKQVESSQSAARHSLRPVAEERPSGI